MHHLTFLWFLPLYKLLIVPLVIPRLGFNVLRILAFGLQGFIRLGKNKSFTCNYFLSGMTHFGVSSLKAEIWKPTNGVWFRTLERNKNLVTSEQMEYSRPQLWISFHFSVVEWEWGTKQKEMTISPHGSFLGMKGITYELLFFFPEANDIFNEIKIGHFKTKEISKKNWSHENESDRGIKFCHVAKFSSGRHWCSK